MKRRNRDRRNRKGSNTGKRKRDGRNRYRSNKDRVRKTGTEGTGIEVQEQGLKKQG